MWLLISLVGCAPSEAEVAGSVLGRVFEGRASAVFDETRLVLVVPPTACRDLGWVSTRYSDGVRPTDRMADLVAVQVDLGSLQTGTVTMDPGGSPFSGVGVVSEGEEFLVDPVREGLVTIDEVTEDTVVGSLQLAFGQDGVAASFAAPFCGGLR